ncbi:hypothetical protein [Butyrivibrio sp. VCB2001]|uniref:hypothetical protein n=1 Tax=Butyrivibrio sp. VCB2001 TaxID=1280667 RepID=UPI0004030B33|nr:hypothetical protein [Butyrivibrio sp. VCB2001]
MNNKQYLENELQRLDRLIKINSANIKKHKNIPDNPIFQCTSSNGKPQFRSISQASLISDTQESDIANTADIATPGNLANGGKYSYVRQSDLAPIKKLVQKQYEERLQKALLTNRSRLARFIKNYDYDFVDQIYQKSAFARKQYISPIIEPRDEFIKDWYEQHPGGMNPYDDPPERDTLRGEKVRTKSEQLLADTFYRLGIPYQYEPEFVLNTGYCKYPDFVLLNVIQRKTYYWEHMGLTDEFDYATRNFKKLLVYERNGLILGENLILSLETEDMQLDMKMVDRKIREYLL